jgi:hypothetical protein
MTTEDVNRNGGLVRRLAPVQVSNPVEAAQALAGLLASPYVEDRVRALALVEAIVSTITLPCGTWCCVSRYDSRQAATVWSAHYTDQQAQRWLPHWQAKYADRTDYTWSVERFDDARPWLLRHMDADPAVCVR